ncbi:MAG: hypothetical protein HYX92_02945 [Chloroflexi bacterium]|nr:hypothetical protein [Chloroflexota bacterium]
MVETLRMTVLSPEADVETVRVQSCRRLDSLEGKVIGLIENGFDGADYYMRALEDRLHQVFPRIETVYVQKPDPTRPAAGEMYEEALKKCDAVIVGVGG